MKTDDTTMTPATRFPFLSKCIEAGGVIELFPLMRDWPKSDIDALLKEIDEADEMSEKAWGELIMKPANFFSPAASKQLDDQRWDTIAMLSEMASVAIHYSEG